MSLLRLKLDDIPVDTPLPWSVYGRTGMVLLPKGGVIPRRDAPALVKCGLYRQYFNIAQASGGNPEDKVVIPGLTFPVESINLKLVEAANGDPITIPTDFMGLIPDTSLIVSHPQRTGRLVHIEVGQWITVHMLVRKEIHAFASEVLCMYKAPSPHIHLSYPKGIESAKVRNSPRVNVTLLALLKGDGDKLTAVSIADFSANGAALVSEYPIGGPGDVISLCFTIPLINRPYPIDTEGVIRHASMNKSPKAYKYGVELNRLSDEQRLMIESFIYEQS